MPSRSFLVLVSCVTCLSSGRSAMGAQSNVYGITSLNPPVVEKTTANLISTFPDVAIVAQASSPSPTQKSNLGDVLPSLDSNQPKPKPTTKPKTVPKPTKSKWPLWWIGTGAVLVVVAGGLLYFLRQPADDQETVASEAESRETGEVENSGIETDNTQLNSHSPNAEQNGHDRHFEPVAENKPLPEIKPAPPANFRRQPHQVSPASENQPIKEPAPLPPPPPEALPVREPTRLAKINIIDELIKELQNPDPTKRRKAIWELAQRGDSRAMQPLLELLIEADSKQRSLILEALSQIGTRSLKPMNRALAISLQDENAEVRKNAIRDLTRIYDMMAQVTQLLRHAVDDPDAEVQETARWALNQLGRIRGISGVDNLPNRSNYKNSSDN